MRHLTINHKTIYQLYEIKMIILQFANKIKKKKKKRNKTSNGCATKRPTTHPAAINKLQKL